ncbi:ATPase [Mycoavidus sp. B2-EB]|uniref:ATPase n=1 Tax=Mycoavidus sp. B2-EB TaxID=2651972 RepID=UPI00162460EB|nr:ATPase [Mycoavidus sp. B2-EB]BBO59899.1 hypothetical protein MPB2EB_1029 [Mycoavidus sp. B2-EB]
MLNEIDSLRQNISRLITLLDRYRQQWREVTQQLAQTQATLAEAHLTLEQTRSERDALARKIEEAQAQLNAILTQLPPALPTAPHAHSSQ